MSETQARTDADVIEAGGVAVEPDGIGPESADMLGEEAVAEQEELDEMVAEAIAEAEPEDEPAKASAPDPQAAADHANILRIREAEEEVTAAEEVVEECKENLKTAKARFDRMVERLRLIVRDSAPGNAPLLDAIEAKASSPATASAGPETTADTSDAEDASWRLVRLSTLDLSDATLKALAECRVNGQGITTVGALADFTSAGGQLTAIRGIGRAKADTIEEAMVGFWASRGGPPAATEAPKATPLVPWREIKLAAPLKDHPEIAAKLDVLGLDTVDDLHDYLKGEGDWGVPSELNELAADAGLTAEEVDTLAEQLRALGERLPSVGEHLTPELLGFEPEPEPIAKPAKGKKTKGPTDLVGQAG